MVKLKLLELFNNLKVIVSDNGDIYTMNHTDKRCNGRCDNRKGKLLKPSIDKYGYKKVVLTKNGKRKTYTVHRLVAMAFIPNPYSKKTVNHIDGNKLNNCVDNLEWATSKEQKEHAIKHGLCDNNLHALKLSNEKRSIQIVFDDVLYPSIRDASRKTNRSEYFVKKHGKEVVPNE